MIAKYYLGADNELFAYKVRPAPDTLPGRFETGTQNHEGLAGVPGAG